MNLIELLFDGFAWDWSCDICGPHEHAFDDRAHAMRSAVAHVANIHS